MNGMKLIRRLWPDSICAVIVILSLPLAGCDHKKNNDSDSNNTALCLPNPEMTVLGSATGYGVTYIWGRISDARQEVEVVLGEGENQKVATTGGAQTLPLFFLNKYLSDGSLAWTHSFRGNFHFEVFPAPQGFYIQGSIAADNLIMLDEANPDAIVRGTTDNDAFVAGFGANGSFNWAKVYSAVNNPIITSNGNIVFVSYLPATTHAWDSPRDFVWHDFSINGEIENEHTLTRYPGTLTILENGTFLGKLTKFDDVSNFVNMRHYTKYSAEGELLNSLDREIPFYEDVIQTPAGEQLAIITHEETTLDTDDDRLLHSYYLSIFSSDLEPMISRPLFQHTGDAGRIKLISAADDVYHIVFVPGYSTEDMLITFGDSNSPISLMIPKGELPMIAAAFDSTGTYLWHKQLEDDEGTRAPLAIALLYDLEPSHRNSSFYGFAIPIHPPGWVDVPLVDTDNSMEQYIDDSAWVTTKFVVYDQQFELVSTSQASTVTAWQLGDDGSITANLVGQNGVVTINDSPSVTMERKIVKFAPDGSVLFVLDSGKRTDTNLLSSTANTVIAIKETADVSIGKKDAPIVFNSAEDILTAYRVQFDPDGNISGSNRLVGVHFVSDMSHCKPYHEISQCPEKPLSIEQIGDRYHRLLYFDDHFNAPQPAKNFFYDAFHAAAEWVDSTCLQRCEETEDCSWRAECTTSDGIAIDFITKKEERNNKAGMIVPPGQLYPNSLYLEFDLKVTLPPQIASWDSLRIHTDFTTPGNKDSQTMDVEWTGTYFTDLPADGAFHFAYSRNPENTPPVAVASKFTECNILQTSTDASLYQYSSSVFQWEGDLIIGNNNYQMSLGCLTVNGEQLPEHYSYLQQAETWKPDEAAYCTTDIDSMVADGLRFASEGPTPASLVGSWTMTDKWGSSKTINLNEDGSWDKNLESEYFCPHVLGSYPGHHWVVEGNLLTLSCQSEEPIFEGNYSKVMTVALEGNYLFLEEVFVRTSDETSGAEGTWEMYFYQEELNSEYSYELQQLYARLTITDSTYTLTTYNKLIPSRYSEPTILTTECSGIVSQNNDELVLTSSTVGCAPSYTVTLASDQIILNGSADAADNFRYEKLNN